MWFLLPFLAALGAAWHHLARGRTARGLAVLVLAFFLVDAFLVRGWVLGLWDGWTRAFLAGTWGLGFWEVGALAWRKFRLATRKGRDTWRDLFLQGGRYYAQGDGEGAARFFGRAARLNPWAPSPHVWMGFSYLLQGRRGRAKRAFRRALARDRAGDWIHPVRRGLVRCGKGRGKAGEEGTLRKNPPAGRGKRKVPA